MESREQQRARLVPALAKITRSRDFRNSLAHAVNPPNSMTIIPVLPDDTMGYVFGRLAETGGRGVVAMGSDHDCSIAVMWPATAARVEVAKEDDHVAQIHRDSEVSMLFQYLEQVGTAVIQEVAAQLMERRDRETV